MPRGVIERAARVPRPPELRHPEEEDPPVMETPVLNPRELRRRVLEILPEIIETRHRLHRIPELMLEERRTAALIRELLGATSLELLPPYLETDTVGLLRGKASAAGQREAHAGGRAGAREANVTLRADIDALPVEDRTGTSWSSENAGCSHACGHDGHTAILLGALRVLEGLADRFAGSVRFVFQPAEEQAGGGRMLVEKGLLEAEPRPLAVFALHGWPGLPVGAVAAAPGAVMAAQDRFRITVTGKGGHGAVPQKVVDPILTAAQLVTSLQGVVSRSVDPIAPAVLSVCTIHGGTTSNVIPDTVVMEGTVRYFERRLQTLIRRRMEEIIAGTCAAAGARGELDYREGYIPLVNDPRQVDFVQGVAETYLGPQAWFPNLPRTMGAEDFAFYLDRVPGVFLRLGLGEESASLHNPEFDFDDRALEAGITVMCAVALETLASAGAAESE
jgi:hippurate hydrolase